MRKSEVRQEMDAIRAIFQEEQELLKDLSQPEYNMAETGDKIGAHLRKHYAKDLIGVHTHHSAWPVTGRKKPTRHPVKGMTDLAGFYTRYLHRLERLPRQYSTLVWLNIKQDSKAGDKYAVACVVYEGLRQFRAETTWSEEDHNPYYLYLTAYTLHKPLRSGRAKNPPWKIRFIFAGLPIDNLHAPEGKLYTRKIKDSDTYGPKGAKKRGIKDFKKLHELFDNDSKEDNDKYRAAWYESIPKGRESFKCDFNWNDYRSRRLDAHFWDLLGWDVVLNGSGA